MLRESIHSYFMRIVDVVASRSTCDRKHQGAIIVKDKQILSTGFNGSIPGKPHCDEVGHDMVDNHCVRTTHAETNAIAQAAKHGVSLEGAKMYCTSSPCLKCFQLIAASGIETVIYKDVYDEQVLLDYASGSKVSLMKLGDDHGS